MSISDYKLRRHGRATYLLLCRRHFEARLVLGWELVAENPDPTDTTCVDCGAARGSVLEATIAADDAAARDDEPRPVPVLPGQRGLFE